jgi:hypothetical protein
MQQSNNEPLAFVPFQLGSVVMTRGFAALIGDVEKARSIGTQLVQMHESGDFGLVGDDDRYRNLQALHAQPPQRIFSAYFAGEPKQKVYVITEHDRSVTTILLPEEY